MAEKDTKATDSKVDPQSDPPSTQPPATPPAPPADTKMTEAPKAVDTPLAAAPLGLTQSRERVFTPAESFDSIPRNQSEPVGLIKYDEAVLKSWIQLLREYADRKVNPTQSQVMYLIQGVANMFSLKGDVEAESLIRPTLGWPVGNDQFFFALNNALAALKEDHKL